MKKAVGILIVSLMVFGSTQAQDVTTVQAMNSDISDHLDLEAVAAVFAEAEDLEDFERRLNDPESRLSNLDMNEDGYVDYLRVLENGDNDARLITIQAVVGKDLYQDVATIDVDVDERGQTRVQVVGDVFMYGPDYIIEPVYHYRPRIFVYLWAPRVNFWCSTFSWGFYPSYWSYWAPYSYHNYYSHLHSYHYYGYTSYYYRNYRRSAACAAMYHRTARQDYAYHHPGRAFTQRNDGYSNRKALEAARPANYHTAMANTKENRVSSQDLNANTKPNSSANARPASQWNDATAQAQRPAASTKGDRIEKGDTNISQRPSSNSRPTVKEDWSKPSANTSAQRDEMNSRPSVNEGRPTVQTSTPSNTERPASSTRPETQTSRPSANERPSQATRPNTSTDSPTPQVSRSTSRSSGSLTQPSRSSTRSTASPAPSRSSTASPSRSSSRSSSPASSAKSSSSSSSRRR